MAVLSVWLTSRLARALFPVQPLVIAIAPLVHASFLLWMLFSPTTMFDATQTVFVQLALLGLWKIQAKPHVGNFLACGLPLGLAILAKGPVVFLHFFPAALLSVYWAADQRLSRYVVQLLASLVTAAVVALAWALPAAYVGGEAYGDELLWGQTAGRMVKSFSHQQPFWFYLAWLPVCLMPWVFQTAFWQSLHQLWQSRGRLLVLNSEQEKEPTQPRHEGQPRQAGLRFACCAMFGSWICLSLVSGKQAYYLIPAIPMTALCIAWCLGQGSELVTRRQTLLSGIGTCIIGAAPPIMSQFSHLNIQRLGESVSWWACGGFLLCGVMLMFRQQQSLLSFVRLQATSSALVICFVLGGLSQKFWHGFDLQPLATSVKHLSEQRVPMAWFGDYDGQLGFAGRLTEPVTELLDDNALDRWLDEHPQGRVIMRLGRKSQHSEMALAEYPGSQIEQEFTIRSGLNMARFAVMELPSQGPFPVASAETNRVAANSTAAKPRTIAPDSKPVERDQ